MNGVLGSTVCGFFKYFIRELAASEEGASELVFSKTTYYEREINILETIEGRYGNIF